MIRKFRDSRLKEMKKCQKQAYLSDLALQIPPHKCQTASSAIMSLLLNGLCNYRRVFKKRNTIYYCANTPKVKNKKMARDLGGKNIMQTF